ncbi:MAG: BACON domain-containing protein [Porphyromonas sp.]|nr:BACON domain-containing protein [Porphyromonas sp.]
MKQINYLAALAVTLLLGILTSCVPEAKDDNTPDTIEEATLSLSSTSLTLANAGGEAQAITVTTNQTKWNAISNAEWIKTTASGNTLSVVAMPNESGKDRSAEILVIAGAASEKVQVVQSAADIVIEVSPDNIVAPNSGVTKLVKVKSNATNWTLDIDEAAQAWIALTTFEEMVQLEIAPNTGDPREAKLYAKSGTLQKEITIQQAGGGTESTKFLLPLFKIDFTQYELLAYEKSRGSFLISYLPADDGLPSWGIPPTGEAYSFACSSEIFPGAFYLKDFNTNLLQVVEYVAYKKNTKDLIEEGYIEFLKENGFADAKYDEKKNGIDGTNKENRFTVSVGDSKDGLAIVHFTAPGPKQPEEFPTFDAFPYDKSSYFGNPIYVPTKVKELELADGSQMTEEVEDEEVKGYIGYQMFEMDKKHAPLYARLYFYDNFSKNEEGKPANTVSELLVVWSDLNIGAWEVAEGAYQLTEEFLALLEKEGFEFYTENGGNLFYFNEAKSLMVVPRGVRFSDVLDGAPVFSMNYFHYEEESPSMNAEMIDQISARLAKQDKALGSMK